MKLIASFPIGKEMQKDNGEPLNLLGSGGESAQNSTHSTQCKLSVKNGGKMRTF